MNKFFNEYADLTAVLLTFFVPLFFTLLIKRKTGRQTRAVAVYSLSFGPIGILSFIFFHLFENSYRAIEKAVTGTFKYDFHFYALILLGVVIACIAYNLLQACWQKGMGKLPGNGSIFKYMLLILLVCLPLFPITPISNVPVICCLISIPGVFFSRRQTDETIASKPDRGVTVLATTDL